MPLNYMMPGGRELIYHAMSDSELNEVLAATWANERMREMAQDEFYRRNHGGREPTREGFTEHEAADIEVRFDSAHATRAKIKVIDEAKLFLVVLQFLLVGYIVMTLLKAVIS